VTYQVNQWLFAAEYLNYDAPTYSTIADLDGNTLEYPYLADGDLYQLMANYS
jgi:hypothetical protein